RRALWEGLAPGGWGRVWPCRGLVGLGFADPRPADLDLYKSVSYRLRGLTSRSALVRVHSAGALERLGREAEEAVPALLRLLEEDADFEVQGAAYSALPKTVGPKTIPLILQGLNHKDPRLRVASAYICGGLKETAG